MTIIKQSEDFDGGFLIVVCQLTRVEWGVPHFSESTSSNITVEKPTFPRILHKKKITLEPGYNDIGLCGISHIAPRILWYI